MHTVGQVDENLSNDAPGVDPYARFVPTFEETTPQAGSAANAGVAMSSAASGAAAGETSAAPQDQAAPEPTVLPPVVTASGCEFTVRAAQRQQLDVYLMVDASVTQSLTGSWGTVTEGIRRYVNDPRAAGTGVGLRLFGLECTPDSYAEPDVEIAPLPGNAEEIDAALPLVALTASPMQPALDGALQLMRSRAASYPQRRSVVVTVTDGYPDLTCASDREQTIALAADAFAATPSVPTYVIALALLDLPSAFDPLARLGLTSAELDEVAAAGGTGSARVANILDAGSLSALLLEVQRDAQPCRYAVPEDADLTQWTLGVDDGTSNAVELRRVVGSGECGDGRDYYLEPGSAPEAPETWAVLCPSLCTDTNRGGVPALALSGCDP